MNQTRKPIICVDFDGVVHAYTSPWTNAETISDGPVPGALRWLWKATEWFQVSIYSSRSKTLDGRIAMFRWFMHHSTEEFPGEDHPMHGGTLEDIDDYPLRFDHEKPAAFLTIDDRAICFEGDWGELEPADLLSFKPWNKRAQIRGGVVLEGKYIPSFADADERSILKPRVSSADAASKAIFKINVKLREKGLCLLITADGEFEIGTYEDHA